MTPSSLFSITSTVSTTPNSYETTTSTLTQSKSPIVLDKIINVQLNNDIISNFIIINVVSIFIIFVLICISLCCVYVIVLYRKKNYCDECKKEIKKKELNKKELNPANLKLAFVESKSENDISSEDDIVICSENNNTKLPNSIDS
jgi:predicted membrane protein